MLCFTYIKLKSRQKTGRLMPSVCLSVRDHRKLHRTCQLLKNMFCNIILHTAQNFKCFKSRFITFSNFHISSTENNSPCCQVFLISYHYFVSLCFPFTLLNQIQRWLYIINAADFRLHLLTNPLFAAYLILLSISSRISTFVREYLKKIGVPQDCSTLTFRLC